MSAWPRSTRCILAPRQARKVTAKFQKILDHREILLNEPIGARAHLHVVQAYVLQGDTIGPRRVSGYTQDASRAVAPSAILPGPQSRNGFWTGRVEELVGRDGNRYTRLVREFTLPLQLPGPDPPCYLGRPIQDNVDLGRSCSLTDTLNEIEVLAVRTCIVVVTRSEVISLKQFMRSSRRERRNRFYRRRHQLVAIHEENFPICLAIGSASSTGIAPCFMRSARVGPAINSITIACRPLHSSSP